MNSNKKSQNKVHMTGKSMEKSNAAQKYFIEPFVFNMKRFQLTAYNINKQEY